jgi:hypothetical protein
MLEVLVWWRECGSCGSRVMRELSGYLLGDDGFEALLSVESVVEAREPSVSRPWGDLRQRGSRLVR